MITLSTTYRGPRQDDAEVLRAFPSALRDLLAEDNGFVRYGGALHVRGACHAPEWHALRTAWLSPSAFHEHYPRVHETWIPFAQDCVGDQFFLVDDSVVRLEAETGDAEALGLDLPAFMAAAEADPVGFLSAEPLLQFMTDTGDLPAGRLIFAYPPFCTAEAADGVSLAAVPAGELHMVHADLAKALQNG